MNAVLEQDETREEDSASHWVARLELGFQSRGDRTVLAHRHHQGPLVVQKPFYPEGDSCHTYLLHPPGGVVGGDQLSIDIAVAQKAHALITTPGSGKLYRSAGPVARIEQQLRVEDQGVLEWLPQDTILFAGCNVDMLTRVDLDQHARFIGWEILCLGRPTSGESFDRGHCRQRVELWRDGLPVVLERNRFKGGDPLLTASWGLQDYPVTATMVATPANKEILEAVRDTVKDNGFSATLLDDVLVCRYLGLQGEHARKAFTQAWTVIRPLLLNKPACPPRIWAT
ncbi:urease accessory protein UreD [Kaarinaea lacus]